MMKKVLKYTLPGKGVSGEKNSLEVPFGTKILRAGYQAGKFVLWCSTNPKAARKVTRHFLIVPTGGEIPADCMHLASIEIGAEVWHVFEL